MAALTANGGFSNYLENIILIRWFRGDTTAIPSSVFIGLLTAQSQDGADTFTEVTGGAYSRNLGGGISTAAANTNWTVSGTNPTLVTYTNAADITFPTATASWGLIVGFGLFDAASAGNLLFHGPLTTSKTVNLGDSFKFAQNSIVIQLD